MRDKRREGEKDGGTQECREEGRKNGRKEGRKNGWMARKDFSNMDCILTELSSPLSDPTGQPQLHHSSPASGNPLSPG